eukprot:754200-Hanusia_phi.AAC.7
MASWPASEEENGMVIGRSKKETESGGETGRESETGSGEASEEWSEESAAVFSAKATSCGQVSCAGGGARKRRRRRTESGAL